MNKTHQSVASALAGAGLALLLSTSSSLAQTTQQNIDALVNRGICGRTLQNLAMTRCNGIMAWNRPYMGDGVKDCYGYTRQVWNAILSDGSVHSEDFSNYNYTKANAWLAIAGGLPVNTGPNDPNWASISSLGGMSKLLPGDVCGTTQGHEWGMTVHYGMYAGVSGGQYMCYQCGGGYDGAYYTPFYSGFAYYYKPIHEALAAIVIPPSPMPFNTIGHNANGAMDFYMVGNNNYAFHNYQNTPNASWNGFGLTSGSPVLKPGSVEASNEDGRLETFFIGTDGNVYHRYQTDVNGAWSDYYSLGQAGGGATKVAAGINSDGRIEIYIIGADKRVYHRWQDSANAGWNAGWSQLGGWQMNGGLCVGFNKDGRQQVFGYGTDGNVITISQTAVNGAWGNWVGLGGAPVTYTTCAANQDGRLEVFAISGGQVCHKWQTTPNGSWSSSWSSLNWGASSVVAARNNDGRLELMAIGAPNGYVAHNYQTSANGGWNGFGKLLNQNWVATSLAFSKNQDGRLELFAVGSDTAVWHIWQTSAGSAWNTAGWSSMGGSWRGF